jgi:predicted nucleotidyltransferase
MKVKARTDLDLLTGQERETIQAFLQALQRQFQTRVLSVLLFGSRARGEAGPDSDVDLAVIVDRDDLEIQTAIRDLAVEIWLEYGLYLSTRVWSKAHWNRLKAIRTGLFRNIEREGIVLLSSPRELL